MRRAEIRKIAETPGNWEDRSRSPSSHPTSDDQQLAGAGRPWGSIIVSETFNLTSDILGNGYAWGYRLSGTDRDVFIPLFGSEGDFRLALFFNVSLRSKCLHASRVISGFFSSMTESETCHPHLIYEGCTTRRINSPPQYLEAVVRGRFLAGPDSYAGTARCVWLAHDHVRWFPNREFKFRNHRENHKERKLRVGRRYFPFLRKLTASHSAAVCP